MLRDSGRGGVPGGEEHSSSQLPAMVSGKSLSLNLPICQMGTTKAPPKVGGGHGK